MFNSYVSLPEGISHPTGDPSDSGGVLSGLVGATNAALGSCALGKRWRNAVDVLSHLGPFRTGSRGDGKGCTGVEDGAIIWDAKS